MNYLAAVLFLATPGGVSEATGDAEKHPVVAIDAAETEASSGQTSSPSGGAAPSVLSSEPSQSTNAESNALETPPDRWPATFRYARIGGAVGAGVTALAFVPIIIAAAQPCSGFFCFTPLEVAMGGAIISTMTAVVGATVYGVVGYRSTEAAARRYNERSQSASERRKVSGHSWLQLPLLLGVFLLSSDWHMGWTKRNDLRSPLALNSPEAHFATASLAAVSASYAFLYHWAAPIGTDGKRRNNWGRAGMLGVAGFLWGMAAPLNNRIQLGSRTEISSNDHQFIWWQATGLSMLGVVVVDRVWSAFED